MKAFRLMVNRSVAWADWDDELLAQELKEIEESGFDLSLTGFDSKEIDDLMAALEGEEPADEVPPPPVNSRQPRGRSVALRSAPAALRRLHRSGSCGAIARTAASRC